MAGFPMEVSAGCPHYRGCRGVQNQVRRLGGMELVWCTYFPGRRHGGFPCGQAFNVHSRFSLHIVEWVILDNDQHR